MTNDQSLFPIAQKYQHIEPFFRTMHQIIEVILYSLLDKMKVIIDAVKTLEVKNAHISDKSKQDIYWLKKELALMTEFVNQMTSHILLLSHMDSASYAEYRQTLIGASGGDSVQLRSFSRRIQQLYTCVPDELRSNALSALATPTQDKKLNYLITAIHQVQTAVNQFWLDHFILAVSTIGFVKGSQGLPVDRLLDFALGPIHASSILKLIGSLVHLYPVQAKQVLRSDGKEQIIGESILTKLPDNYQVIAIAKESMPSKNSGLDGLSLRPITDELVYEHSPYVNWFYPGENTEFHFETHGYGLMLQTAQKSTQATYQRLQQYQNDYWAYYFSTVIPLFQQVLFHALEIPEKNGYAVTIDGNVTALLERLLSALPDNDKNVILCTDKEFLTVQRALAGYQKTHPVQIIQIPLHLDEENFSTPFIEAIKQYRPQLKLVIFPPVASNWQMAWREDELNAVLASTKNIPVILDATQCCFNIPLSWGKLLKKRKDIFVLGSLIKHARCGAGGGFLIHPEQNSIISHPTQSGWCSYLSGLPMGQTMNAQGELLYDERYQWFGGTPQNPFCIELFINTWGAILETGQTIQSMHQYIISLQQVFLACLAEKLSAKTFSQLMIDSKRRQLSTNTISNTLVLQLLPNTAEKFVIAMRKAHFHVDRREDRLRIGFGIEHSVQEVKALADVFCDVWFKSF